MTTKSLENIQVLDCSIRDGGHLNKWNFTHDFAKAYFQSARQSGVDIVELGYRSSPGTFKDSGDWRFTLDSLIRETIGEGPYPRIAVMADAGKARLDDFPIKIDSPVDIVRVACYNEQLSEALDLVSGLKNKGYFTTINLMGVSQYSERDFDQALDKIKSSEVDVVYVADSFGSLYPEDVRKLVSRLKEGTGKQVGFHAHNNIQMAFTNSIAALEAGATYIDATVNGIGRGAGNLPLEMVIPFLNRVHEKHYDPVPILELTEGPVKRLKQNLIWGYNLPFLLSAVKSCHPNYALTLKKRGYAIREIHDILNLMDAEQSAGFNQGLLEKAIQAHRNLNPKSGVDSSIDTPIVALLPCHKGSQRVKDKNTRDFADSSLTEIKINQLVNVPEISRVLVFTDDEKVESICKGIGSSKIQLRYDTRPVVKDNDGLIAHFADKIGDEQGHLLWTHVTCPFMTERSYSRAIRQYLASFPRFTSLVSVKKMKDYIWDENKKPVSYNLERDGLWPKTQNIPPLFAINSGIFMLPISDFRTTKKRLTSNVQYFECSEIESSDIDWEEDFERAQLLWRALQEFEMEQLTLGSIRNQD